jgi:hypothetical protein
MIVSKLEPKWIWKNDIIENATTRIRIQMMQTVYCTTIAIGSIKFRIFHNRCTHT